MNSIINFILILIMLLLILLIYLMILNQHFPKVTLFSQNRLKPLNALKMIFQVFSTKELSIFLLPYILYANTLLLIVLVLNLHNINISRKFVL